jgi:cytosolic carboxypeptidase protein 2/3
MGMNPNIGKNELIFDSCFEGGNLDCAVRLRNNEYDLLLRVDSNTAGHILWFDFKVINPEKQSRCIKFNIVNLRKNKSAY